MLYIISWEPNVTWHLKKSVYNKTTLATGTTHADKVPEHALYNTNKQVAVVKALDTLHYGSFYILCFVTR